MIFLSFRVRAMAMLLVLLVVGGVCAAQTSNGTIAGIVTDPQGAVVQKATIIATNIDTGESHKTTSNSSGAYRIESVVSGRYNIAVTASGFKDLRLTNRSEAHMSELQS